MNWYLAALKKYADFSGRARRKEYWMFVLFYVIFGILAVVLDKVFKTSIEGEDYGLIYMAYILLFLSPYLAVTARRLHDIGKSGWMFLINLIPIIGSIWLFVLTVTDSQPGKNKYGPNPKTKTKRKKSSKKNKS